MTKIRLVVDTWVLEKCNDGDCPDCVCCVELLTFVLRNGKLCLDHEEDIEREYGIHIKPRTFLFQWWNKIIGEAGHISRWSNKLSARHERKLLIDLKFHNDDIKFVGVAARSTDKIIVSGDSDYNQTICDYLFRYLGVKVVKPDSILNP